MVFQSGRRKDPKPSQLSHPNPVGVYTLSIICAIYIFLVQSSTFTLSETKQVGGLILDIIFLRRLRNNLLRDSGFPPGDIQLGQVGFSLQAARQDSCHLTVASIVVGFFIVLF